MCYATLHLISWVTLLSASDGFRTGPLFCLQRILHPLISKPTNGVHTGWSVRRLTGLLPVAGLGSLNPTIRTWGDCRHTFMEMMGMRRPVFGSRLLASLLIDTWNCKLEEVSVRLFGNDKPLLEDDKEPIRNDDAAIAERFSRIDRHTARACNRSSCGRKIIRVYEESADYKDTVGTKPYLQGKVGAGRKGSWIPRSKRNRDIQWVGTSRYIVVKFVRIVGF